MTTRKYFSLTFLGIGLVLAGFAAVSSRTQAPVLPAAERNTAAPPSPTRSPDAGKAPAGSVAPVSSDAPQSSGQTVSGLLRASLVIGEKTYDLQFHEGETLYQAMRRLEGEGALTIQGTNFSGIGFFIDGLNGVTNGSGKYWVYSINGVKATLGVEGYRPKSGETIVWMFEESY